MKRMLSATTAACLSGSAMAATLVISPGDPISDILKQANDGDTVRFSAGVYKDVGLLRTTKNITVVGAPFEDSNGDPSTIGQVQLEFNKKIEDNWLIEGETTLRGLTFLNGDHQLVVDNRVLVEHCSFKYGVDLLSFNSGGYGEVANCEFYISSDDCIDVDSSAKAPGAFLEIHHCYFERSREDGIELRTYPRREAETMRCSIHHNTFMGCGTDLKAGGDAIQIIDQNRGESSRTFFVYNNVFDGNGATINGLGCNDKSSDAQEFSVGGTKMKEPVWVYNNTCLRLRGAGISGSTKTFAFNNIIKDSAAGLVRCSAKNNLTHNVKKNLSIGVTASGENFINQDPGLNGESYRLYSDGFAVGKGLKEASFGSSKIVVDSMGDKPNLGAFEKTDMRDGRSAPNFRGKLLSLPDSPANSPLKASIAKEAHDADGDSLSFSKVKGPAWLNVAADGSLSGRPESEHIGRNSWIVRVSDGRDGEDTIALDLLVKDDRILPFTADAGADQTVVAGPDGTASVTLDASASTGDIVQYRWRNGPVRLPSGVRIEHDFPVGIHKVMLKVKNADGETLKVKTTVTVKES